MQTELVPALPQTCCPTVWLWPGQALYSGPGLGLEPHSGSVWCLAVGVDGPLTVTVQGNTIAARSVLIPPRLTHHPSMQGALVSCYLDPSSQRSASCRQQFTEFRDSIGVGHAAEPALTTVPDDDEAARRWLDRAAPDTPHRIDPRIELVAKQIREGPATAVSAREFAAAAGLSESRFLHLFRREAGTSLRRYRMWSRLVLAGTAVAAGQNLTTAAADSGFASPSHLADSFKTTFGLSATRLLTTGLRIRTP
ncbi:MULTISPECIES: AraC family transcriptional regulator [unclassified Mycolicibacterium]|uniref:AraC family transcriptional regulator n=1 Tax=unclassified Mycolicibacterium TaxID=2636767 RepID=UPI0012DC680D|nr:MULTISPECIES: AraC family transcriptional regulator [unclassified Mycolicibacterium]MUL80916.1 helix-turn-helix transcriptional regulator [Mycolicibacterium sp. CBMA 329]MUL86682.1 helix-turn-helix transcriptional regulator [Mycolicibacterium sp. CBMA 331]MUM02885.1 helix-turn-helix transcriptional regulator [Mycolicibacterium sp. CBMA 334]MUM29445.1 helix-turn-helix transcriptional regulator [Mycolicibacterium sp. CBMA 295]MUM36979.1 helix-turn-helix transcriptional regulator [Mycolicibact